MHDNHRQSVLVGAYAGGVITIALGVAMVAWSIKIFKSIA